MADRTPQLAQINGPLDEVLEDLEERRVRPTDAVTAWLDDALANRLGIETAGMSRGDREYLLEDLLEVFLAGAIAQKLGWTVVEEQQR